MRKGESKYTLEDLIKVYQSVRKKHGDKAKSCKWIEKQGYSWLYNQVRKRGFFWNDFKEQCGFKEKPLKSNNVSEMGLIKEYQELRKKHGDKTKSCEWLINNGYGGLYQRATRGKTSWDDFKKKAGFDEEPLKRKMDLEELIKIYQDIRKEHGDKAINSRWFRNGEHAWLYGQVCKKYKIKWEDFKNKAGFKDEPLNRFVTFEELLQSYRDVRERHSEANSSGWMIRNDYGWIYTQVRKKYKMKWDEFKKQSGFDDQPLNRKNLTLEDLVEEYKVVRKEHGDKAKSCKWIQTNGYKWLHNHALQDHGLQWNEFKKTCGFKNDSIKRHRMTIEELLEEYKDIRKEHGDKAKTSNWLYKNKYSWLPQQVTRAMPWAEFLKLSEGHFNLDKEDLLI
jgi:hypothetical protein